MLSILDSKLFDPEEREHPSRFFFFLSGWESRERDKKKVKAVHFLLFFFTTKKKGNCHCNKNTSRN